MSERALEIAGVSAWYGHAQALFDVDIAVEPGEVVAVLGRNGAGKTTMLRSVMGIQVRRTGHISVFDTSVDSMSIDAIARIGVGWVPEDRRIFPNMTVRENLLLAEHAARKRAKQPVPLETLFRALPIMERLIDKKGSALSGGEQQAVAIARALAGRPRVLLLDEPTEGLAPVIVSTLSNAVATLPDELGVSILVAEQNLSFVRHVADRVYVLDTGTLVYEGTAASFSDSPELQHRYLSISTR